MTYNPSRVGEYTPTIWAGTTEATNLVFNGTGTDTLRWRREGNICHVNGRLQYGTVTDFGNYDAFVIEMPFAPPDLTAGDVAVQSVPIFIEFWLLVGANSYTAGTAARGVWGIGEILREAANDGRMWCYAVQDIGDTANNISFSSGLYQADNCVVEINCSYECDPET